MSDWKWMKVGDIVSSEKYPFTIGQMRFFLMNRETNGLSKAVKKIGKCLYIRSDLFEEWFDNYE